VRPAPERGWPAIIRPRVQSPSRENRPQSQVRGRGSFPPATVWKHASANTRTLPPQKSRFGGKTSAKNPRNVNFFSDIANGGRVDAFPPHAEASRQRSVAHERTECFLGLSGQVAWRSHACGPALRGPEPEVADCAAVLQRSPQPHQTVGRVSRPSFAVENGHLADVCRFHVS
jgi:hypothetical protein